MEKTVSFIAEPQDSRCKWFSAILEKQFLNPEYLTTQIPLKYLRRGQDLQLVEGTFIIDSESVHHRKNRGNVVQLGVVYKNKVFWIEPKIVMKYRIKEAGHKDLMKGSGDFTACVRIAIFISRQETIAKGLSIVLDKEID